MKFLHTADVHLHSNFPQRMEALEAIAQLGRDENIDALLIAGDLFDDHHQAEILRGKVRRLFSNLPYKVLAIPGNHDERAFSEDAFYGSDFTALTEVPFSVQDLAEWRIVAVPYGDGSFAPLREPLRSAVAPDKKNILMLHCSWSLPHYTGEDYGGDDLRYLPVTEASLRDLGYNYILAGHFHTAYRQRRLPCGSLFVYPGSPVSVSAKEQGRRSVNVVDAQGCRPLELAAWYCHSLNYYLDMQNPSAVLEDLSREILLHPDDICSLTINIGGYIQGKEKDFQNSLDSIVAGRRNTTLATAYRSAEQIFADPLYIRFRSALDQEANQGLKSEMEIMLLDSFSQLMAEGR